MTRSSTVVLAATLLCIAALPGIAQRDTEGPPVPFVDSGACPFEGCPYRAWKAQRAVAARRAPSPDSAVTFRIPAGATVTALTGIVVITRPGQVRFRDTLTLKADHATLRVTPADTLFLLTYEGEGFTKAWFKGRLYRGVDTAEFYNTVCQSDPGACLGRIVVPTRRTWWVKVRDSNGRIGWIDDPDAFGGKDAIADPNPPT